MLWQRLTLVGLFLFILFHWSMAQAQDVDCPEGYKCIPDDVAARYFVALKEYQCLQDEADKIKLEYEPFKIVTDREGRLFSQEKLKGTLTWCSYHLKLSQDLKVKTSLAPKKPEPDFGFRPRFRLGVTITPQSGIGLEDLLDPTFLFEAFYWKSLHLSTHASLNSIGLGLGLDITKNFDIYAGVGVQWLGWTPAAVFGASLSFN